MKKIAISAQMGSGKSFISLEFAKLGIPLFTMDEVTRFLQNNNKSLKDKIEHKFPGSYSNGKMNKDFMVRKLFFDTNSSQNLKDMSELIKPYILKELELFYEESKSKPFVLVETAILFEYGLEVEFDKVIFVNADKKQRKEFAMKRDGISSEEYDLRMRNQIPDEVKIGKSDYIINNDYTDSVVDQVKKVYDEIISLK